eukprot:6987346-Alexandrium_andersonii.AAC.1
MIDALSHCGGDAEGRTIGGHGRPKLIEVPPGPGDFQLCCNEDDTVSVLQKVGGYWGRQANRFSLLAGLLRAHDPLQVEWSQEAAQVWEAISRAHREREEEDHVYPPCCS